MQAVYKKRRARLIQNMPEGSALILPSRPEQRRSGDVDWPYRPSSDILYLSGFEEPNACLVLLSPARHILFTQKKNPEQARWTGPIHGPELACDIFRMDSTFPSSEFARIAPELLKNSHSFYYPFGFNPAWDTLMDKIIQALTHKNKISPSVHDPLKLTAPFRMFKTKEEIKKIKKAVDITAHAFKKVMRYTQAGQNEGELNGLFVYEIRKRGALAEAYPGIFASGPNACILHYTRNNRTMQEGECLLMDAGAEYQYYASDITRTFPVSGRFSKTQKRLYTKLLKIQKKIISQLKPGMFFSEIQNNLVQALIHLMKEEKLLAGSVKNIVKKEEYKRYFPHFFGHSLGLDVHDVALSLKPPSSLSAKRGKKPGKALFPPVQRDIQLKEGFVLTIEPGLYLPPEDSSLPGELRGLGFRIEDDILIGHKGPEVLSRAIPKEPEELEDLLNS